MTPDIIMNIATALISLTFGFRSLEKAAEHFNRKPKLFLPDVVVVVISFGLAIYMLSQASA